VPRLFVDNHSRRPIDPFTIAEAESKCQARRWPRVRDVGRRLVFA
jgi:hypothetical protein